MASVLRASGIAVAVAALVAACGVAPQASSGPKTATASIDAGGHLFNANCARCHGSDAKGTAAAPDLLGRVRGMSQDRFVEVVLHRYAWTVPASEARSEGAQFDAMAEGLIQKRSEPGAMPAWQDEPAVHAGVGDLFLYLQAEAGRQGR